MASPEFHMKFSDKDGRKFDAALERLIDVAGREKVFSEARRLGWGVDLSPQKWVWMSIASDVIRAKSAHEAI